MSNAADGSNPPAVAWQPLTFGGVAAFASAKLVYVLLTGFLVAVIFAVCFVWFLERDYSPIILRAIQQMPESAGIENGRLQGVSENLLTESKLLAIAVTPANSAVIGQDADIQIQLRQTDYCVNSIFQPKLGLLFDYDHSASLKLSRSALEPWWGAWHPVMLASAAVGAIASLFASWVLLAAVYTLPGKFIAWYADRNLSWPGAWKLNFAAMTPAALVMTFGFFLYGWHAIDLVQLSFFWIAHLVMCWVYMIGATMKIPRLLPRDVPKQNPFA